MAPRRLIKWLALVAVCALFLFAVISTSGLRQIATHRLKFGSAAGVVWRKRVGVEPTILAAKDRINGFEGHEDHRTSLDRKSVV